MHVYAWAALIRCERTQKACLLMLLTPLCARVCAQVRAILGLQHKKTYSEDASGSESREGLRYGRLMLMTDQDHDGSHIKGLVFNVFHFFWPSLLKRKGFVVEFVTPLVKATPRGVEKDKKAARRGTLSFYTSRDFEEWFRSLKPGEASKWHIKYYKGLGTSDADEAKDYFSDLVKHKIDMVWGGEEDDQALLMAFGDDADRRKDWLSSNPANESPTVDHSVHEMSYKDFVYKELIQFSHAHMIRSIPSVIDGLKPGQRKVLYSCFIRKLHTETKLTQLAGHVSEKTAYHHGETSLFGTIIKMAQDFVGSNNLPLLLPAGQFGTRLQGGNDHASPRYLHTRLMPHVRLAFREEDDAVLEHAQEDGESVEPVHFVPIIPMILVNGAEGIATGWSTSIPMHCPLQVIDTVADAVKNDYTKKESLAPLLPWYAGFTGKLQEQINRDGLQEFLTFGRVEQLSSGKGAIANRTVVVTELPIGRWTSEFQSLLDKLCQDGGEGGQGLVQNYRQESTQDEVKFEVI